ncbi:MAG: hypothetical protein U1E64_00925 [Sphingomonadaceae bacterium]
MYSQPTRGPAVPPVIRHIFLVKPAPKQVTDRRTPAVSGVLAELAAQRCH